VNAGSLEVVLSSENACSIAHHLAALGVRALASEPAGVTLKARETDLPRALLAMNAGERLVCGEPADGLPTIRLISVTRAGDGWIVLAPDNELRRLAAHIKEQA